MSGNTKEKSNYVSDRTAELSDIDEQIANASQSVQDSPEGSPAAREAKQLMESKLAELKKLRAQAGERLSHVRQSAEHAWESVRDEAEFTWRALRASLNYFRSYFRSR